jgi:hypothetical protein
MDTMTYVIDAHDTLLLAYRIVGDVTSFRRD